MIIGTAGHVDHGKTALVRALTGIDADRLPEEKRRGITIDLGYAYAGGLGFVDVPGHERLVHTMLAGASGIDAALLVVALTEGVMPQTREHLQIIDLLGIDRGVTALTKADIAADRVTETSAALRRLLAGCGLAGSPIIPVSAVTGHGISDLSAALATLEPRVRRTLDLPRLSIDRAFNLPGTGLVLTGTLVAGRIAAGDRLVLSPRGLDLRVRGLHVAGRAAETAEAGARVALNVSGPRLAKDVVTRGDWVLHPAIHAPSGRIDARIRLLQTEPRPLRPDTPVHLHVAAAHVMARAFPLDREQVHPGETGLVRLTLAQPIGVLARDRVVLRDAGAARTVGGGVVVHPFPPRRGARAPLHLAQLEALDAADPVDALRGLLARAPGWAERDTFFRARATPPDARPAVERAAGAIVAGGLVAAPETAERIRRAATVSLAAYHRAAPDQPGLSAEQLRVALPERFPADVFPGVVSWLLRERAVARNGSWLCLPGHRVILSDRDQSVWIAARQAIASQRFRPPRVAELGIALGAPDAAVRSVLKRMQRLGELIEIAPDHFFLRATVAEMADIAAGAVDDDGVLAAGAFRDRLANGRRVAIEILEFFDHAGLTNRKGDLRTVRAEKLSMFGAADPPAQPETGNTQSRIGATGARVVALADGNQEPVP